MAWDWGSIIGGIASIYSGSRGASAARDAGRQQAAGSQAMIDFMRESRDRDEARQQPFYNAGVTGLNEYLAMLGLGGGGGSAGGQYSGAMPTEWFGQGDTPTVNQQLYGTDPRYRAAWDQATSEHQGQHGNGYTGASDRGVITQRLQQLYGSQQQGQQGGTSQEDAFARFRNTPGYEFGMQEGLGALDAAAAARGSWNSGAQMRDITRFARDYSDQQGYTPYMNRLASLFGAGQTAAGNMGQSGQYYGGQMGQGLQNQGNARANSTYAQNDAWQGGVNNAMGFFGEWYGNRNGGG